jgi:hypothetical protein
MSKYTPLWEAIGKRTEDCFILTYAEIEEILGFPIDHAFLTFKKELPAYGYEVGKISMKAQTVAFRRCAAPASDHLESDTLFFFDGRPDALALYEALTDLMKKTLPEFTVKVQKSQISFYNRHLFAMVSLPRRKSERGLIVSFGLGDRLDSSRVAVATEPYPNRWTHHVPVTEATQLDEELLGWLREAYDFAAAKSR